MAAIQFQNGCHIEFQAGQHTYLPFYIRQLGHTVDIDAALIL